jgi:hypothetical protein
MEMRREMHENAEGIRKTPGRNKEESEEEGGFGRESGQGSEAYRGSHMEQGASKQPGDEQATQEQEEVTHPAHYAGKDIECIDYIHAQLSHDEFIGYLRGNAIKYLSRFGTKDAKTKDAAKAIVYLGWLYAHEAGELDGNMPSMIVDRLNIADILNM